MDCRADAPAALVAAAGRFQAKVQRVPGSECWYWFGGLNQHGYGLMTVKGYRAAAMVAHRVSYLLYVGPLDDVGLEVHHTCEVRCCVNPAHLVSITKVEHVRRHNRKRRRATTPERGRASTTHEIRPTLRSALSLPERWTV